MESVQTAPALFTDDDLAAINSVRTLLDRVEEETRTAGWKTSNGLISYAGANGSDFGRVSALAGVAADALFDLLNVTSSYRVQTINYDTVLNRSESTDA